MKGTIMKTKSPSTLLLGMFVKASLPIPKKEELAPIDPQDEALKVLETLCPIPIKEYVAMAPEDRAALPTHIKNRMPSDHLLAGIPTRNEPTKLPHPEQFTIVDWRNDEAYFTKYATEAEARDHFDNVPMDDDYDGRDLYDTDHNLLAEKNNG